MIDWRDRGHLIRGRQKSIAVLFMDGSKHAACAHTQCEFANLEHLTTIRKPEMTIMPAHVNPIPPRMCLACLTQLNPKETRGM